MHAYTGLVCRVSGLVAIDRVDLAILEGEIVGLICPNGSCKTTLFNFFFSSRRRHTRSLRDWSSDVCSSDLQERQKIGWLGSGSGHRIPWRPWRSEERRVGKECRSQWAAYRSKKKRARQR